MNHQALQKENNRLDRALGATLPGADKERLNALQIYLRGSNLTRDEQEAVRHDLLTMVDDAWGRGESLSAVIGDDDEAFMNDVIAAYDRKPKAVFDREMVRGLFLGLAVLLLLKGLPEIAFSAFSTPFRDWQTSLVPAHIITGVLLLGGAVLAVRHLTNHAFAMRYAKAGFIAIYALIFLLVLAVNLFIPLPDWSFTMHPLWLIVASAVSAGIAQLIP